MKINQSLYCNLRICMHEQYRMDTQTHKETLTSTHEMHIATQTHTICVHVCVPVCLCTCTCMCVWSHVYNGVCNANVQAMYVHI